MLTTLSLHDALPIYRVHDVSQRAKPDDEDVHARIRASRSRVEWSFGSPTIAMRPPYARTISRSGRSEEHTSELQSLMRISYAVFCLKKKNEHNTNSTDDNITNTRENNRNAQQ